MSVRYHSRNSRGWQQALTRKAVLVDLASLPVWLAQSSWAGEPIYLMAEPVHGPLQGWRKGLEKKHKGL